MPSTRRRVSLLSLGAAAAIAAGSLQCLCRLAAFVAAPGPASSRAAARRGALLASQRPEALRSRWQHGFDTAFFDIDSSLEERFAGLREILLSPGAIAATLRDAIWHIADKGLTTGHRKALDSLFPPGTLARSDLEGILAVVRQAPEVMGDLWVSGAIAIPEDVPDTEESLDQMRRGLSKLLTPEGVVGMVDAGFDGLRKTPKALQEPEFEVSDRLEDYEVRRYPRFTLATRTADGYAPSGGLANADPFSAMASHLMRSKGWDKSLKSPMLIRYNIRDMEPLSISFFVPPGTRAMEDDMEVVQVTERLLAIRRFPGIATTDEVKRQYKLLMDSLQSTQIYEPWSRGVFSVIQYNPPYTIPWRRRNEIAVEVTYNAASAAINRRIQDRQLV